LIGGAQTAGVVAPVALLAACGAPGGGPPEAQTKAPVKLIYLLHNNTNIGFEYRNFTVFK
jgi:hypothetical protein